MISTKFAWQSLLNTDAPSGCSLKAGLFTTYDRADERLLVEHLLPLLLKLSFESDGEGAERQYFLLELDRRLTQMHDKLVVVSSTLYDEPTDGEEQESGTYGWIWRSIRHLTVGSRRKAVQHSKLWLLHWGAPEADGVEYLELVVSSANLTRAGFKGQLQAAWRGCIKLLPQPSDARLSRWGILPDFLRELATSAGDDTRLAPFVDLLARADAPEGVTFIASVPGTHSRQVLRRTPWGAAGLREIAPAGRGTVGITVLTPFVGSWSVDALSRWCAKFEGLPSRLQLIWIDKNHPWARGGRWMLPKITLRTLSETGATLLCLRHEPDDYEMTDLFHEEHRLADDRWSHAKVYLFERGNSRRLLVTSANFSTSAWGSETRDGELAIENFELGVCVEQAAWPFEELEPFEDGKNAATVLEPPSRGGALIMWAQATWDGKEVTVDCRCAAKENLKGEINAGGDWIPITEWAMTAEGRLCSAHVSWDDAKGPPLSVRLRCGHDSVNVVIFDERPLRDRENTVPPEVDRDVVQTIRDELLFEQYGGRVATDVDGDLFTEDDLELDGIPQDFELTDAAPVEERDVGRADSYAVAAFVLARRHLRVVDNWAERVKGAQRRKTEEFERQLLRRDGELMIEAFEREAIRDDKKGPTRAIGAKLATEELALRLKHFVDP